MVKTQTKKSTTARRANSRSAAQTVPAATQADSVYVLKLVLYLIIGSQWIRITRGDLHIPIPVGLIVGIMFARLERFQIDRKIEYAILLLSMFIGFWLPLGLEIVL